tara:strand:- start:78 stop:485 length:408 start_codon:yes stop_codon:yes gene_type:complete
MPDYIPDPNNSKKQIPGPKTDKHYDSWGTLSANSQSYKQPSYVMVTSATTLGLGFYFGSATDFSQSSVLEQDAGSTGDNKGTVSSLSGSEHYLLLGDPVAAGTYHINPIAISGSAADVAKVRFVYKGGLDGLGRP